MLLIFGPVTAAQIPLQQAAFVRGVLVTRDLRQGEFSVRAAGDQVVRYRFDVKTYVEDADKMIDVSGLRPGEQVEVLSDLLSGSPVRYARTIHVIYPPAPRRVAMQPGFGQMRFGQPRSAIEPAPDPYFRPDDLTYAGVVVRFSGGQLVLRTRDAGERSFRLRPDTNYLADGVVVAAADLKPNMLVFVRAGKDADGRLEVYRVMWGGILIPR